VLKKFVGGVKESGVSIQEFQAFLPSFYVPVYVLKEGECQVFEGLNPIFWH
jgi:hypothetical protein